MADTIYAPDPWSALAAQHSDIRREGSVERGEIRYDTASKAGDIRREVAEGVSNIRREQAVGFDETRYAVAGSGSDRVLWWFRYNGELHNFIDDKDFPYRTIQHQRMQFYLFYTLHPHHVHYTIYELLCLNYSHKNSAYQKMK